MTMETMYSFKSLFRKSGRQDKPWNDFGFRLWLYVQMAKREELERGR